MNPKPTIGFFVMLLAAVIGFVPESKAGVSQLISKRNAAVSQSAGGNGYSAAPSLTPDGRFVLFTSTANNVAAGDNSQLGSDVFVHDRLLNTTTLVSVNSNGIGGGNGNSAGDMISPDGRFVLFESDASDLVTGDSNGVTDIFLRDMLAGTTTLVSVATNGGPANGASSDPVMTPDGRFVAFLSVASNLVTGDNNGIQDVFVRDLQAGTTTLVSVGATNPGLAPYMYSPVISTNGQYVAFYSIAQGLVSGMTQFPGDVYLRDVVGGVTTLVSSNLGPFWNPGAALGFHPILSDDGRFVAFKSVTNSSPNTISIFRYDSSTGSNTLVSANGFTVTSGSASTFVVPIEYDPYGPEMTPDGRFIAYVNLAQFGGTNTATVVRLWDGQLATDTPVSVAMDSSLPTNTLSDTPAVSPDGRYVVFMSTATNLVTNVLAAGTTHVYLRDMQAGVTQLIDVDTNGAGSANVAGAVPSLSTNGQFVAFTSWDGGFVPQDNNLAFDVFVRDTVNLTTEIDSARNPAVPAQSGGGISLLSQSAVSPDGRWLVFTSRSDDLVTNDFNTDSDVFVADLLNGTNILVSVATNGNSGLGGASTSPVMSTNGRYVAFISAATNLVTNDAIIANKLFYRDLVAGTTVLASADSNGVSLGTGDCSAPAISQDGRYLAFICKTNFGSTGSTFWKDMVTGQGVMLSTLNSAGPTLTADGRYACYTDSSNHLAIWDSQTATVVLTSNTTSSGFIVPGGTRAVVGLTLVDFISHSNLYVFSIPSFPVVMAQPANSSRYFAFAANHSVGGIPNPNLLMEVYLTDIQAGTTTLISANSNRTAIANANSDSPIVSGDGRFVVFRSYATDVVPGISNVPNIFVFDRVTGSNTLVTTQPADSSWSWWTAKPALSGNGAVIAFESVRPGLVAGSLDLNRLSDVFTGTPPWLPTDSVGDGISDAWRAQYFGGNGTTTNSQSCATCDPDHDGMSNLQEYLAGTSPIDPSSSLRLQASWQPGGGVLLSWPAVPGKSYQVRYKSDMADVSWTILANGMTAMLGYQCSLAIGPGYYQVVALN